MRNTRLFMLSILVMGLHAWPAAADEVRLRPDAPESHVVVKGDTLWDISARFLNNPWKWPEVWGLNRDQIKNPHLIYPGDVVRLTRDGKLALDRGMPTVKLSPQVSATPLVLEQAGIPSVPYQAIAHLLNRGGVMPTGGLTDAPYILGSSDERVVFGLVDQVYATAGESYTSQWQIVRPGSAFRDPDTGEILGYQLLYIGQARTLQPGSPQLVSITSMAQEVLERDRLIPDAGDSDFNYVPHAPEAPVAAKVVAALGGVEGAGAYTTLVVNQGREDGLEPGHVLGIFKAGRSMADPKCIRAEKLAFIAGAGAQVDCRPQSNEETTLPDRRIGVAFVYRVFDRLSYALVMSSEEPVYVRDSLKNP